MSTPVLVAPPAAELSQPYVTAGMFTAFPTWLDLDNLIPGGIASLQASELTDVLLTATDWAVGECENMPLHAHWVQNEEQHGKVTGGGRVQIRPRHIPLRMITSLSLGWDPSALSAMTLPLPSQWIEDGRRLSFNAGGSGQVFTGPAIQFGPLYAPETGWYVQWSYVAGYPNATLAAPVTTSSTSVQVTDPAGILPGDVLRIYDIGQSQAGANEALTVASTYSPAVPTIPATPTAVPISGTPAFAHSAGTGITGMPRKAMQAVIAYAVALLMREDVAQEIPQSRFGPASRTAAEQGSRRQAGGLVNDARGFLAPYRPTWR